MNEEVCKICGRRFKNLDGHLRMKHLITREEYERRFIGTEPAPAQLSEPVIDDATIEHQPVAAEPEPVAPKPKLRISDVQWLEKSLKSDVVAVAANGSGISMIEPKAIGIIKTEEEEIPSLLFLTGDGRLVPAWFFSDFKGIYTKKEARKMLSQRRSYHPPPIIQQTHNPKPNLDNLLSMIKNEQ